MNTLSADELQRRGLAALEDALRHGPVHLLKRNRPAAVVLSEQDYQRLLERAGEAEAAPVPGALEWAAGSGTRRRAQHGGHQSPDQRGTRRVGALIAFLDANAPIVMA